MAGLKRQANVPKEALKLGGEVSKADLLEAAWYLASLCNGTGRYDDKATLDYLRATLDNMRRERLERDKSNR